MKIQELKVSNFKSLSSVKIEGGDAFANVNMIFGFNNSGKSNLMKLLYLVFKKKYGGAVFEITEDDGITKNSVMRFEDGVMNFWEGQIIKSPFLFTNNNTKDPIKVDVTFEEDKGNLPSIQNLEYKDKNIFTIRMIFEFGEYQVSEVKLIECLLNQEVIFDRDPKTDAVNYYPKNPELKDNENAFIGLMSNFNNAVLFIDSDRYFGDEKEILEEVADLNPKTFKNWLLQLYLTPDKFEEFESLVQSFKSFALKAPAGKQLLEDNFSNSPLNNLQIDFTRLKNELGLVLTGKSRLPIESYGTGIQQIFYILSRIFNSNHKVLLIEELELNLSPEYQLELLKFLVARLADGQSDQLFFTSHSNYMATKSSWIKGFFAVSIDSIGSSSVTKLMAGNAGEYFSNPYIAAGQA